MNTIISDPDLIPRVEPLLPDLFKVLNQNCEIIYNKLFFDFMLELVRHYHSAIGETVLELIPVLVRRIVKEL
jgi:hypothetical protein